MPPKKYVTQEDIKPLEGAFRTLNREMGVVQGQLIIIKWLMGGTLLVVLAEFVKGFIS